MTEDISELLQPIEEILSHKVGVSNHWTGLLDWTTGLDYWTAIILCTVNDNDVIIWPWARFDHS